MKFITLISNTRSKIFYSFYGFHTILTLFLFVLLFVSLFFPTNLYSKKYKEQLDTPSYEENEFLYYKQFRIKDILLNQEDVFEKKNQDWFWGASFLNSLHSLTKPYIIEDELLFFPDDKINLDLIEETERNLRRTTLFTKVWIELDSVNYDTYNVIINTQDKWSLEPAILYGTGGGISNYGLKLLENNFLGTATALSAQILHRTENNIGLQGDFAYKKLRFLRSDFDLSLLVSVNKFRNYQSLDFIQPYRTLNTENSYGISLLNKQGSDFLYQSQGKTSELMKVNEKKLSLYYSKAFLGYDRSFITLFTCLQQVDRGEEKYKRAFDNSGQFFASFSSVSENYIKTNQLDTYLDEDLQVGGYGSAVIGRTFSIGKGGETLWYIGADGETSYYTGDFYVYLRAAAGSAFFSNQSKFVSQESEMYSFLNLGNKLTLNTHFVQQTVWRWNAIRQLILDSDSGLRGIPANSLVGDNRIISNTELRYFPDVQFWVLNFSAIAFFDIGTVWNQNHTITSSKFYKTAGIGFRLHNLKVTGDSHILRVDLAYNISDGKFGGIIFGTQQYFSAFKQHLFKLPKIIGLDFDEE